MTDKPQPVGPTPQTLRGRIASVVFHNAENDFSVVRVTPKGHEGTGVLRTVVGMLHGARAGEEIEVTGKPLDDPKFGPQFRAESCRLLEPSDEDSIVTYLSSGLIPGVGPATAQRIVDTFGQSTLRVLDEDPGRMREVPGIGAAKAKLFAEALSAHRSEREVMLGLLSHGLSANLARRIVKRYGPKAAAVVRNDPYRLAEEVYGIGFVTADRIAEGYGVARDAPARMRAGVAHTLSQRVEQGHVFERWPVLVAAATELLQSDTVPVGSELVRAGLVAAAAEDRVIVEDGGAGPRIPPAALDSPSTKAHESRLCCYPKDLHIAERLVAQFVADRVRGGVTPQYANRAAHAVTVFESQTGLTLTPLQREAVVKSLSFPLHIITGGPGTGKTTIVRAIATGSPDGTLKLAAPTGRAAKRLTEAAGRPAQTIHRLLEYKPDGAGAGRSDGRGSAFARNDMNPLEGDALLVDETSMLDLPLAADLFAAVPKGMALTLVGDVDQLPSVGPGRVFADLIDSGLVPVTRLDRVFRQGQESLIVNNAHRVNHGLVPDVTEAGEGGDGAGPGATPVDFFLVRQSDPETVLSMVLDLVSRRIPSKFGFDPLREVQVLCPMQKGTIGVANLNQQLQARLNPHGADIEVGPNRLREGDKVIQLDNDYDRDVFNGDVGRIVGVDAKARQVTVRYPEKVVEYDADAVGSLGLAYALTIHKSQGSEYPAVVLPLVDAHFPMLQRNLLYTGMTRAKKLLVVVASPKALEMAVRVGPDSPRFVRQTSLAARVKALVGG